MTPNVLNQVQNVSKFRRLLPQVICSLCTGLILFNIGMALSYPTIIVNTFVVSNSTEEGFTMDSTQASIYVSVTYGLQPLGSIVGGSLIQWLGRKRLMIAFCIPMAVAWLLQFFANSAWIMYFANGLIGFGIGLSEPAIATYIPELAEVEVRGALFCFAQMFLTVSFVAPYVIALAGSLTWRYLALIQFVFPLVNLALVIVSPESPIWLVSQRKYEKAGQALQTLRGWVNEDTVKNELNSLILQQDGIQTNYSMSSLPRSTEELMKRKRPYWRETVRFYLSARMIRPFLMICTMFGVMYFSGLCTLRPYLGTVIEALKIEGDVQTYSMYITLAGLCGSILSVVTVPYIGKRWLFLSSLLTIGISFAVLAWCSLTTGHQMASLVILCVISCFTSMGVLPIPWIMQGDLYPFRGRGFASGVSAAVSYLIGCLCTSVYLRTVSAFSLHGVFFLFTTANMIAFLWAYMVMPETEGKTFEEIDEYFENLEKYLKEKKL